MDDAILRQRLARRDDACGTDRPAIADLASDRGAIQSPRERLAQDFGETRDRSEHSHRIAMHKDEARIRIDLLDLIEREDVVGAFQHPTVVRFAASIEIFEEVAVEAIGFEMPGRVEPCAIGRHMMRRIEAQAGEDMCVDLAAFLRRSRRDRVHRSKIRRESAKGFELAIDLADRACLILRITGDLRMDCLPTARHGVGHILDKQSMQKAGAAAR